MLAPRSPSRAPVVVVVAAAALCLPALGACVEGPRDGDPRDVILPPVDAAGAMTYCDLGAAPRNLRVPDGFCLREFAVVPHPRTLAFTPDGDLFVGSPAATYVTTTGPGIGGVVVLSDDDHDGRAERREFLAGVPEIHGIAIGGGYLWYTTRGSVVRTPLAAGQRAETPGMREDLRLPPTFAGERSTHPLARSVGGQLYSSRSIAPRCGDAIGEIYRVRVDPANGSGTDALARGFRNPMYARCHFRDEVCAVTELGDDSASPDAALEKLLFLGDGASGAADYGLPACHTTGVQRAGCTGPCASVVREDVSFRLNDTPFGFDWERGVWPEPFRHGIFVALHGSFYQQYRGAGVVWLAADATTHRPSQPPNAQPFVQGFGDPRVTIERPADVAFAPDGRLFFSVDQGNKIYWVAPTTLRLPGR